MSHKHGLAGALACCAVLACSTQRIELLRDAGASRDAGPLLDGGFTTDARVPDSAVVGQDAQLIDAGPPARCGGHVCKCDDGLDNDGDGLVDGLDPECTGALDEDEASFATGNMPKDKMCRDCFWDEDPGTGNDACRYPMECLSGSAIPGKGNCSSCVVSNTCVDTCGARTPSGCDCFGCCDVERTNADGSRSTFTVELSEHCSMKSLTDPKACPPCFKSDQCANACDRCELCPGRTMANLPADCQLRTPPNSCDPGQSTCTTSSDCGVEQYCQLGCCFGLLL